MGEREKAMIGRRKRKRKKSVDRQRRFFSLSTPTSSSSSSASSKNAPPARNRQARPRPRRPRRARHGGRAAFSYRLVGVFVNFSFLFCSLFVGNGAPSRAHRRQKKTHLPFLCSLSLSRNLLLLQVPSPPTSPGPHRTLSGGTPSRSRTATKRKKTTTKKKAATRGEKRRFSSTRAWCGPSTSSPRRWSPEAPSTASWRSARGRSWRACCWLPGPRATRRGRRRRRRRKKGGE